jgi:hypothetical protein
MAVNKIYLQYPVKDPANPQQTITMLTLRRPTVGDKLAVANLSDAMADITLMANLTEQSPDVIKALDYADFLELQEKYLGFFPKKHLKQTNLDEQ